MPRVGHYYKADHTYQVGRERSVSTPGRSRTTTRRTGIPRPLRRWAAKSLIAPMTFTAIGAMAANRQLLEEVVVGYDTFVQTEQVFEQHRPITVGDELNTDVELSSVRRIAGRDMITITNTFLDVATGETVHTMHTTVVSVTADEVDPGSPRPSPR